MSEAEADPALEAPAVEETPSEKAPVDEPPAEPMVQESPSAIEPAAAMAATTEAAAAVDLHKPAHSECENCGALLHGRFCADCGQAADDHHRPVLHLAWEGIEGLTHLDGRMRQTLPLLLFRPGKLARDQLEGRKARHVPPFRMFFIALLLFMVALEGVFGSGVSPRLMTITVSDSRGVRVMKATPQQTADVLTGNKSLEQVAGVAPDPGKPVKPLQQNDFQRWVGERLNRAMANPEYFQLVVFTWAHRLAILLLPICGAQLALLYFWKKKFYFYDHLIVSMQILAFAFLVVGLACFAPQPARGPLLIVASLWIPVNLFMLLRGAYGSGIIGALWRTIWLWLSTQVIFGVMVAGLFLLGLQQI